MSKPLRWLAGEVKTPPMSIEARREMGFLLRRLQEGEKLSLPHSRPMPSIGKACHELRVNDQNKTWRLFYLLHAEAIVILEVDEKKTPQTLKQTIAVCQKSKEAMKTTKSKRAKSKWVEGSVKDFLSLSDADMELIETRLIASRLLKETRRKKKLTQQIVATRLHTSQSRLAKMEAGDPSVSLDLLFKSLFSLGISRKKLAKAF
jgi:phage-related protein/DNA-binding XRE family transcriptional regulator